jgi:hypothetical protein
MGAYGLLVSSSNIPGRLKSLSDSCHHFRSENLTETRVLYSFNIGCCDSIDIKRNFNP